MVEEDKFCTEVLNLDCKDFLNYIDRTLVCMAKDPQADIFEARKLYEIKQKYMVKIIYSMEKFKKLNFEQQLILYLYYIKNKPCYYIAQKLRISDRTFFRKLNKIKEIWFQDEDVCR